MEGALERTRVTALPLQVAARVSPGTGISSMEIITAMHNHILVPWRKQQAERGKTALDLLRAASDILQPFGVDKNRLDILVNVGKGEQLSLLKRESGGFLTLAGANKARLSLYSQPLVGVSVRAWS